MTERLNHKLNVDTIKTVKDVKNVFYTMELVASVDVDNPVYEVAKEYFTIPYVAPELEFPAPRKSIEEITQELDEKIDALIKTTKEKFECSNYFAGKRYNQKFDRIIENFEYAREHGHFIPKVTIGTLDGSYLVSNGFGDLNWTTSNYVLKPDANGVGYYQISSNFQFWMKEKPNLIIRTCAKILLGLIWKDA